MFAALAFSANASDFSLNNKNTTSQSQKLSKKEIRSARSERRRLKRQSKRQLETKMKKGDRIAGFAIADLFAEEASSLISTPVLANSAREDAIRWYNLSARKGTPRTKAVANVSVPAIRVARKGRR